MAQKKGSQRSQPTALFYLASIWRANRIFQSIDWSRNICIVRAGADHSQASDRWGGGTKVKGPQVVVSELKVLYNYVKQGTEIQADLNLSTFSFNYTSQCMCFMLYNSFNLCFAVSERRIGGLLVYTDMRRPMPACLPRHMQMRMGPIKR